MIPAWAEKIYGMETSVFQGRKLIAIRCTTCCAMYAIPEWGMVGPCRVCGSA